MFTVISAVALILVIAINLFVTSFGIFGNFYIDLTPEGLYTVRDVMYDVCRDILYLEGGELREPGIRVIFCDDPDNLIENTYTRLVYYMAVALGKKFPNFEVDTVNVRMDPTSVARYKSTSLTEIAPTDVIVAYGDRYTIASAQSFWRIGTEKVYSFDGEYKLASIMMSLTLVNRPVAYFVTDHGEDYYAPLEGITDEAELELQKERNKQTGDLYDMLTEKGLEVKTLSLSGLIADAEAESQKTGKFVAPAIPEDCVLLIINDPKTDFREDPDKFSSYSYVSETELLYRYMSRLRGSVMVAKDYKIELPILEDYLSEWGIEFSNTLVVDTESYIKNDEREGTTVITEYNKDEASYGYSIYSEYASLATAPRVVIGNTGYIRCSYGEDGSLVNEPGSPDTSRIYAPFLFTSESALDYAANEKGEYNVKAGDAGRRALAAVACRQTMDPDRGIYSYSYMFCAASADFFTAEMLGNPSYANYDVCAELVQSIARLETAAPDSLGGTSVNNHESFYGKFLVDTAINASGTKHRLTGTTATVAFIIIEAIPVCIAVIGIVVFVKRKYL